MANITTQTIRVDLSTDKVLPTAFTHQNDTARTLEFSMYNKGMPYTMTGNTVKFAYKSPIVDGQYTVITGSGMASGTVSGNKVTVTLPSTYTAISGVGMLTMIITPTSGTVRPVNIRLVVQKSADGDDTIAGASDFPATLGEIAEDWLEENISIQIDDTLSVSGKAADAKVTGDEIANLKSDLLELQNGGYVADAQRIGEVIDGWLDEHPEATTTVQDGSLTYKKLVNGTFGFVTPEMYGAKGDGVTDDTLPIQTAVNVGLPVIFAPKTYRCSNIVISEPIHLFGSSSTLLKVPDDVDIPSYSSYTENTLVFKVTSNNVYINGICFDGNYNYLKAQTGYDINAKFSSYGIRVSDVSGVVIENCVIDNVKDAGIQLTESCTDIIIRGNVIGKKGYYGAFNRGIQCIQSESAKSANYKIVNNEIYNSGEHGIVVYYNNDNTLIEGNTIVGSGLTSVNPDGSSNFTFGCNIKLTSCSNVMIANNHCINGLGGGILSTAASLVTDNVQIKGNQVLYDGTGTVRQNGIQIAAANSIVEGNIICGVKNSSYSQSVGLASTGANVSIIGNVITDCDGCFTTATATTNILNNTMIGIAKDVAVLHGQQVFANNYVESTGTKDGIAVTNAKDCIIAGNTLKNTKRGMIFRESADGVNIYGNVFISNTQQIYWVFGTPTNSKVDFVAVS